MKPNYSTTGLAPDITRREVRGLLQQQRAEILTIDRKGRNAHLEGIAAVIADQLRERDHRIAALEQRVAALAEVVADLLDARRRAQATVANLKRVTPPRAASTPRRTHI